MHVTVIDTLSSSFSGGSSPPGDYQTKSWIEKIIVVGITSTPTSALLDSGKQGCSSDRSNGLCEKLTYSAIMCAYLAWLYSIASTY